MPMVLLLGRSLSVARPSRVGSDASSAMIPRRALLTALLTLAAAPGRAEAFAFPSVRSAVLAPPARGVDRRRPALLRASASPSDDSRSFPPRRNQRRQRVPKLASPSRHVRIRPRSVRGDRRKVDVQTAVTSYSKSLPDGSFVAVDLHAQIHVAERDYFAYYSDAEFTEKYDRVHYELVVGEDLLNDYGVGRRVLRPAPDGGNPLAASPLDVGLARGYGLACQVDSINYARDGWVHADYSREEFVRLVEDSKKGANGAEEGTNAAGANDGRPIWALASSASIGSLPLPSALAEFFSALSRPLSPSTPLSSPVDRRLFSNLFLPGDALTSVMRAALWLAVPSPEASVMLLDWSSLTPRPTGGLSPVFLPVLECLLSGNVAGARKLVFGQMVVSGQSLAEKNSDSASDLLVNKRNDRAAEVLRRSIERDGCRRAALLFGGAHCRGLDARLREMGFVPRKTEWRTAWSVDAPRFGYGLGSANANAAVGKGMGGGGYAAGSVVAPDGVAVALLAVPLYLALGGWDWASTVRDVGTAAGDGQFGDAALEGALYLVRHVALYLGLSKFVVEWDGGTGLFGGGGEEWKR